MTKDTDVKTALANLETETTLHKGYVGRRQIYERMGREETKIVVSGITKANPGVATTAAVHGLVTGDRVYWFGMNEMTDLEAQESTVIVNNTTEFSIENTSSYAGAEVSGCVCYQVGSRVLTVTGITKADPGVVTTDTNHGLLTGYFVRFWGLSEITSLNTGRLYPIIVLNATTFSIIDTSDEDNAETSGGFCEWLYEPETRIDTITSADPGVITTLSAHNIASTDLVYFEHIESGYVVITGITNNGSGKCRCAYTTSDQFLPVTSDDIVIAGSDVGAYNVTHTIGTVSLGTYFDTDIDYATDGAACTGESEADTMEDKNDLTTGIVATAINATSFSIPDTSALMKGMNGIVKKWGDKNLTARDLADDHLSDLANWGTRFLKSGQSSMGRPGYKTI